MQAAKVSNRDDPIFLDPIVRITRHSFRVGGARLLVTQFGGWPNWQYCGAV
jgi:hypothetical protein